MASGWAGDNAVNEQIDASIHDKVTRIRSSVSKGVSADYCEDCNQKIPEQRKRALQGVRCCVHCQSERDGTRHRFSKPNTYRIR